MYAHAHAINPVQARIDRRHAERDWQADAALFCGVQAKLSDLIEELQSLHARQAFNCRGAHDELPGFIDALDDIAHDYLCPMEAAIAETEPGKGLASCPV
jgi:hypothetical protein